MWGAGVMEVRGKFVTFALRILERGRRVGQSGALGWARALARDLAV